MTPYKKTFIATTMFGHMAERICQSNHMDYYIKDDLRREMDGENQ